MLTEEIKLYLDELGEPSYRYKQILEAIYKKSVKSFSDITTLSKDLRLKLEEKFPRLNPLVPIHTAKGDQAEKVLFETPSGNMIEAVKLIYHGNNEGKSVHNALCISSQSGCALGCKFCATGAIGFKQNLSADEIVGQYQYFKQQGDTIDSIIFMGMGEPFANENNLFEALHILTDPSLYALSLQKISISTVGLVPGIERLTKEFPQVNLAFSLHSPFNDQRSAMMPVNNTYPIEKVFDSLDRHIEETNKKIFIAYTLLKDVNDSPEHAAALAGLINQNRKTAYLFHVNIIRYNSCPSEVVFERSDPQTVKAFQNMLTSLHIQNTLRQDFGVDIDAACGQLYAKYARKVSP